MVKKGHFGPLDALDAVAHLTGAGSPIVRFWQRDPTWLSCSYPCCSMEDVAMRIMDMDFTPLSRSTIGFDRLIDLLENSLQGMPGSNYPPYNIEKTGEDSYRVTLAVAGFGPEDLSITTQANKLTVTGRKADAENVEYLYQGIAGRSFQREFSLADYVKVNGANLDKGLLTIDLMREVPDAMKPRRIVIGNGSKAIQIERQVAA